MRRSLRIRPVRSVKEILDSTSIGVAAGTVTQVQLADTLNTYAGAVATNPIGARINGIYLFQQIQPEAAQGQVDWFVWKNTSGAMGTSPTPGATGGDPKRKWILHEEKGIPGIFNNGAAPLTFRDVIRIPPKMKRQGEDDGFFMRASCSTVYDLCLKSIYKWFA